MIIMKTEVIVKGILGKVVFNFMLNCTDNDYKKWWPGTHIAFHTIKRYPNNIGNLVLFDEYVGKRRLTFNAIVTDVISEKRLVWQMKKFIMLPGWLTLDIIDNRDSVNIIHILVVGFRGAGRIFDPIIIKMFLTNEFQKDLEEHAQIEFHKLEEILS